MNQRQVIVDRLQAIVAAVVTNTRVWQEFPADPAKLSAPVCILRDTADNLTHYSNQLKHSLTVELILFAKGGASAASQRQLISDVLAAIGQDTTLSGACSGITPETVTLGVTQEGYRIADGLIELVVDYSTINFAI